MQAHCTSPGTTTHAAAPKNDIMLFVAVLPLGEPENLWVSDASSPQGICPGVKVAGIFQWLGAFYYLFDLAPSFDFVM